MPSPFRLLTQADVRRSLDGVDLVALMEDALRAFSAREVVQPVRTALFVGPERSVLGLMPAHVPSRAALGAKLVAVFNSNHTRGLPSHFATILLMDDQTGELVSIMDGSYITETRTAAVSAVAVRHLASGPACRLAVFGCGVQARSHVRAIAAAGAPLRDVRMWSPVGDPVECAAELSAEIGCPCTAATGGEAAAEGADVIVLATSSPDPVIDRGWVNPGALVISVGACRRDHREMDPELVAAGRLFVDSRDAALVESGDIVQGIAEGRFGSDHVRGELGEVILGRAIPRERPSEVVVFKSLGLAVEDLMAADAVYRRAVAENLGTLLTL
ncbi:MAG: ornithine cyclodeaminase family protein [Acidobacteria bacterium]|nr:ornithine cyclodeaminase family protein [Acidobacteriota bacterium]